jgi:hypothetical protein
LRRLYDRLRQTGHHEEARTVRREMQRLPIGDPYDPAYRRLRYVRYADDFLLGFNGPRFEAEGIKEQFGAFLRDQLKLELSEAKTLISHARMEPARFLGYDILVQSADTKRDATGRRSLNGKVGLRVPAELITAKCRPYLRHGKAIHRSERLNESAFSIVALPNGVSRTRELLPAGEQPLETRSVEVGDGVIADYDPGRQVPDQLRGILQGPQGVVDRDAGKKPLVA